MSIHPVEISTQYTV